VRRGGPFGGTVVEVEGLRDLNRSLARMERDVRLGVRRELRSVGEPVASEAESLALGRISGMPKSPGWAAMRVGVTANSVYVVPVRRGTKTKSRKRSNLADLMMDRAMQPAFEHHRAEVVAGFDRVLDGLERRWAVG
jgi:hypothetical protein